MFTDTPHFVLIGRNSTNLDNFRREISIFGEFKVSFLSDFLNEEGDFLIQSPPSGIFFELEDENDVLRVLELTKRLSLSSDQVPIIVIFDALRVPTLPSLLSLELPSTVVRLMKRPLLPAEIGQEAKNILIHHSQEAERLRKERITGIRQFISGLSHEMGNILLRILGGIDLAMVSEDVNQIHKRLEGVQRASERARVLVRNIQVFSKGSFQVSLGHLSVALGSALELLEDPLLAKNVTVTKEGLLKSESEEPKIAFDAAAMTQTFYNLIENALFVLPEAGGKLRISYSLSPQTHAETQGIEIKIIDNGAGMSTDTLKRMFEVGFSTHKDTAAGLGLPISREIILSHGGWLKVNSSEGAGTEISIWLPRPTC